MPNLVRLTYRAVARRELQGRADRLPRGWGQVLDALGAIYLARLRAATPVSHSGDPRRRPGTMRDRWQMRAGGRGVTARRSLANDDPALPRVRRGRGPIDRRGTGHPLHFWAGGRELWRWYVRGVAPNDFVARARAAARRDANRAYPGITRRVLGRANTHW